MTQKLRRSILAVCIGMVIPQSLFACAACYGKSDSQLALGMNWGIFSLLFVVACVLGTISAFFIYLAKRSAAMANQSATLPEPTTQKI